MVRKILASHASRTPPVRLYWDDVEHIADRLQTEEGLEVRWRDLAFEDLDEFRRLTKKEYVSELKLRGRGFRSRVLVDIDRRGADVTPWDEGHDVAAYVTAYLRAHSPWYAYSSSSAWWSALEFAVFLGIVLLTSFDAWSAFPFAWWKVALGGFAGFILPWAAFNRRIFFGVSRIYLERAPEARTFWERNRDDLLKQMIAALVGALVGFVLGRLLG